MKNNSARKYLAAIPTLYSGYQFRSRTEARWAVFFDRLRIGYEYELEGFRLQDGTLYLPDFYLPRVRLWAEVKPTAFTPSEDRKCGLLVEGTGRGCLLLEAPPGLRAYSAILMDCGFSCRAKLLLDIDAHNRRYYEKERRFYVDPEPEWEFTPQYQRAVLAARYEQFDVRTPPRLGHEPFNLTPGELDDAWGGAR